MIRAGLRPIASMSANSIPSPKPFSTPEISSIFRSLTATRVGSSASSPSCRKGITPARNSSSSA